MFRFIHTADIHLDSPLISLAKKEPEAASLVATATRQSFENTINMCIQLQVDALLIAGDLYDGNKGSMKTAVFFADQMRHLEQAGIQVYMIRGNHDAQSVITKHLDLPKNVHVFSTKGEQVVFKQSEVVIHGVSFAQPHAPDSLLRYYSTPVAGAINIGLLHTSLAGSSQHCVYAPCSLQELIEQGYDYWALGHIHKREVYSTSTCTVVMPGIPQGRHINEPGARSITYVQIDDERHVHIEELHPRLVRFERVSMDISGLETQHELVDHAEKALAEAYSTAETNYLIARIHLQGKTPLWSQLHRDKELMYVEMREAAKRSGSVFIEQIENETYSPTQNTTDVGAAPINELRELLGAEGFDRTYVTDATQALLEELRKKLPVELKEHFDVVLDDTLLQHYLQQGADSVLAQLTAA